MTAIAIRNAVSVPDSSREVVEVVVRWGATVLQTMHLETHETLRVGEGTSVVIPGLAATTLVDRGMVKVPEGAVAKQKDARTAIEIGAMQIEIGRVQAEKALPKSSSLKKGILGVVGASLFAHVATVAALAMAPGASLDDENASLDRDTAARFLAMNQKSFTRELEQVTTEGASSGGDSGSAHKGPSGLAGTPSATSNSNAYAMPKTSAEERLGLLRKQIEAGDYGAIGALSRVFGAASTMGINFDDDPSGHDALAAVGHLTGPKVGEAYGMNGLGLASFGPGGNGFSDGLGIGNFTGFGHGPGNGDSGSGWCDDGNCTGTHVGAMKHKTATVKIYEKGEVASTGALPKEVVRRIVRANFPSIRACYDAALRKDPALKATVSTRFVIDQTGAVETATSSGEPMLDGCVQRAFSAMSFPAPENGKALVSYPIDFAQE
ncbi:MAG: AgmX/PglI C-terminal domain-containing protein [Polyangiales bacterium]